jgi:hypothetical protein
LNEQALIDIAGAALRRASKMTGGDPDRQVRQPDSWLLRHCYRYLARHGSVQAALEAVALASHREPKALYQALPLLARRAAAQDGDRQAVAAQLFQHRAALTSPPGPDLALWAEKLLAFSATAAHLREQPLALSYLERLDQIPRIWNTVFAKEELRALLAESLACIGPHPLTNQLIQSAIRQHAEPGSLFLQGVALQAAAQIEAGQDARRSRRLLQRVADTFRYATLVSLLSRRYATLVFALVEDVEAMLDQITIIANVQDARRESGLVNRETEGLLVRQVKRPWANEDIDFRLYTLKEAVERMDPARLRPEQRATLAEYLTFMGAESDGWTAAAATSALLHLGQYEHAVDVVNRIQPRDSTRSEAFTVLIQGLLSAGLEDQAASQTEKAINWAQALPELHPERLTIWGVAKAYLAANLPRRALYVLERRRAPGLASRFRRLWSKTVTEEDLREEALRLHANLLDKGADRQPAIHALQEIRRLAPALLEGKSLALFYTENVLEPLLESGHHELLWSFLGDVQDALSAILSREQPARVEAVSEILVAQLAQLTGHETAWEEARSAAQQLLARLWQASGERGIWPAVYTIGGSLPLLIALAGDEAAVEIAYFAAKEGADWRIASRPREELLEEM